MMGMKPPAKITSALKELDTIIAMAQKDYDTSIPEGEWPPWLHKEIGGSPGTCTNTARWLARKLGGLIFGYYSEDNPAAKLGDCEGGHDFAVVDGRWIVDWWAYDTYGPGGFSGFEDNQISISRRVYDLTDPRDARLAKRLYGDPVAWGSGRKS